MTAPFPTPYSVTHTPYDGTAQDDWGNSVPAFGDPVTRLVYGWAPHLTEMRDSVSTVEEADTDLYMPPTTVNLKDRFTVDGALYEVVGVQDWNHGFHGWTPGIVAELCRVDP